MFSFFKKSKCEICSAENAKSFLTIPEVGGKRKERRLCKSHFFDEYKKIFLTHPYKMVVTYPILETRHSIYGYYDATDMKKYDYADEGIEAIQKFLSLIPNDKECAYFDKIASRSAIIKNLGQLPNKLPKQNITFISKDEAWSKIYSGLASKDIDFSEGFSVPYGKEGAFLTSFL